MKNSIKDYRKAELKYYVIGNILVILLISNDSFDIDKLKNILYIINIILKTTIFLSLIYVYTYILDSSISAIWKDKLIYFYRGRPGDTIFTKIQNNNVDFRFTPDVVKEKYSNIYKELEKNKKLQNSCWYEIYKKHENKESIYTAHRDFLLNRDMCTMTLVITILYVVFIFLWDVQYFSWKVLMFFGIEFLITNIAARNKAWRFAYNVIAMDIHENKTK